MTRRKLHRLKDMELLTLFQNWGVFPTHRKCPLCKTDMILSEDNSKKYVDKVCFICYNEVIKCDKRITIRDDTLMEGSKLTLNQLVSFVIEYVEWSSSCRAQLEANINVSTGKEWNLFCQEVVIDDALANGVPLGGPGTIVDFCNINNKFKKRKYHRDNAIEEQWIFSGTKRGTTKSFMIPVVKRNSATLIPLIIQWILPGTKIISGDWSTHTKMSDADYKHLQRKHNISFAGMDNYAKLHSVESFWRREMKITTNDQFIYFLAKYLFTKKCKMNEKDCISEFFAAARMGKANPKVIETNSVVEKPKQKKRKMDLSDSD